MDDKERRLIFRQVASQIKEAGYDVYIPDEKIRKTGLDHYGYVTDGINLSQVGVDCFGVIHFTSIHKPSAYVGSGFSMDEDIEDSGAETIKEKVEISFKHLPKWGKEYKESVKTYKGFEEFRRFKEKCWNLELTKL